MCVCVCCTLLIAPALINAAQDNILSANIKEATPGSTDQNTNQGSGIKTDHIVNGAVTDAKISGPINSSKIQSLGLNADTLDGLDSTALSLSTHQHDSIYEKKYARVIIVSADGNGDFTDLGTALDSITDASSLNPYLIKIMPGNYNFGAVLTAKSFVDIEGSGKVTTTIGNRLIIGVSNCEIRNLTIVHDNPGNCAEWMASSVMVWGGGMPILSNVSIISNGGSNAVGVLVWGSSQPVIIDSDISASTVVPCGQSAAGMAIGYYAGGSNSVSVERSRVNATGNNSRGMMIASNSSATMRDVEITGSLYGIILGEGESTSNTVKLYNSKVQGLYSSSIGISSSMFAACSQLEGNEYVLGSRKYFNCFDGNFDPIQ